MANCLIYWKRWACSVSNQPEKSWLAFVLCVHYSGHMVQEISAQRARDLLAGGSVELIDVRESGEWASGHAPGARHVPLARLRNNFDAELGTDGVIFVCAAGVRSEAAARLALAHGFRTIYNLSGGMRGWTRAGLPLVRD